MRAKFFWSLTNSKFVNQFQFTTNYTKSLNEKSPRSGFKGDETLLKLLRLSQLISTYLFSSLWILTCNKINFLAMSRDSLSRSCKTLIINELELKIFFWLIKRINLNYFLSIQLKQNWKRLKRDFQPKKWSEILSVLRGDTPKNEG